MVEHGGLVIVYPHGTRLLRPRPDAFDGSRDLDSDRLDTALGTLPPHTLTFQHGVANVVRAVERGDAEAGVLLRPPTVEQIAATAHAREKMPPKSTFFWPKPRTGTVFRSLDVTVCQMVQVAPECSSSPRSPGPFCSTAAASCCDVASAYSGRVTARKTPIGVGSCRPVEQAATA